MCVFGEIGGVACLNRYSSTLPSGKVCCDEKVAYIQRKRSNYLVVRSIVVYPH